MNRTDWTAVGARLFGLYLFVTASSELVMLVLTGMKTGHYRSMELASNLVLWTFGLVLMIVAGPIASVLCARDVRVTGERQSSY